MSRGVGWFCGCNVEAKGGSLILMGRGVLVSKVPDHAGEVLFDISWVRPCRIAQVSEYLQRVGIGGSLPNYCNLFRPEDRNLVGETTITEQVSIKLKNLDIWEVHVLEQLVQLEVGA